QGFIESDTQDVAVDGGHLRQWPERRPLLNQTIDRWPLLEYPAHQAARVLSRRLQDFGRIGRQGGGLGQRLGQALEDRRGRRVALSHLVQRLEGERAAQASVEEWARWENATQLLECLVHTALEHRANGQQRWCGSHCRRAAASRQRGVPRNQRRCLLQRN